MMTEKMPGIESVETLRETELQFNKLGFVKHAINLIKKVRLLSSSGRKIQLLYNSLTFL